MEQQSNLTAFSVATYQAICKWNPLQNRDQKAYEKVQLLRIHNIQIQSKLALFGNILTKQIKVSLLEEFNQKQNRNPNYQLLSILNVKRDGSRLVIACSKEANIVPIGVVLNRKFGQQRVSKQIQERDTIQVGKVQLNVASVSFGEVKLSGGQHSRTYFNYPCKLVEEAQQQTDLHCRICHQAEKLGGVSYMGYLVNPCSCKGSVQKVHLGCLLYWLDVKQADNRHQSIKCQICTTPLTTRYLIRKKRHEQKKIQLMINPDIKGANSIILKGYFRGTLNRIQLSITRQGSVYFIGKNTGRKMISIKDESLSDVHAGIILKQGHFLLRSNDLIGNFLEYPTVLIRDTPITQHLSLESPKTILKLGSHYIQLSLL